MCIFFNKNLIYTLFMIIDVNHIYEFIKDPLKPLNSFKLKDNLNPKIWKDFRINKDVRKNLLKIAYDFYKSTDINASIKDIIFCGSLCNYNWSSKYSDIDLHIVIKYSDINEDVELVRLLLDYMRKNWNNNHNIFIKGYKVEISFNDINDIKESIKTNKMGGIFSLLKNKWIKKPNKVNPDFDIELIKNKSKDIIDDVDKIIKMAKKTQDVDELNELIIKTDKIWDKIKNYRKSGLESEGGELSNGNLIFKLLRRNGYIKKIIKLKKYLYDKQFK